MPLRTRRLFLITALALACAFTYYLVSTAQRTVTWSSSTTTAYAHDENNKTGEKISCLIEGTKRIQCIRKNDEIYMPFNAFIRKQFDVSGRLVKDNSNTYFEFFTSYAKVRVPEILSYDPFGPFGHFGSYNVEIRDRVRCISAENGVPMSTQWDSIPYFYPIQIAQFALQHFSRSKTELSRKASKTSKAIALTREKTNIVKQGEEDVLLLEAGETVRVDLQGSADLPVVSFAWIPQSDEATFSVALTEIRNDRYITLNYKHVKERQCVWIEHNQNYDDNENEKNVSFTYALGSLRGDHYVTVVRDLLVDTSKALASVQQLPTKKDNSQPMGLKNGDISAMWITFRGPAKVRLPLVQLSHAHSEMFMQAAEWFVENQNEQGGWSVPVERTIADNRLVLKAGWHSAMAQGHALSVLTRAFHLTKDQKYVNAARKGLDLFNKSASDGGVSNRLFGHIWYEEYPTVPGTFVLNGFLYSLIGLYDASAIPQLHDISNGLFTTGLQSLNVFLPLFDTGSGSVYDLRHLGLKSVPNIARWDYHAVHIYLLKWLFNITGDRQLNEVADRWIGYAHGKKAKHN